MAGGIHRIGRRQNKRAVAEQFQIFRQSARILGKIFAGSKLRRIDEDGDDCQIALAAGGLDQAHVPGMQGPHSRHQSDRLAGAAGRGHFAAQLVDVGDQSD
jgi:hypothetical protein